MRQLPAEPLAAFLAGSKPAVTRLDECALERGTLSESGSSVIMAFQNALPASFPDHDDW